jgi:hypothetical protein
MGQSDLQYPEAAVGADVRIIQVTPTVTPALKWLLSGRRERLFLAAFGWKWLSKQFNYGFMESSHVKRLFQNSGIRI